MNTINTLLSISIIICFAQQRTFAQAADPPVKTEEPTKSIESGSSTLIINLGVGFPTGEYADTEQGGGAKSGLGIGVEFQYNLTESFYLGAMYRNQTNGTDEAAMRRALATSAPVGINVASLSVSNWKLNDYMVGMGTISSLNNEDIKVYTKIMIGLCNANSPSIQTTLSDGNTQLNLNQLSAEANNFAALFGLGFRVHAGESVDVLISGDYFTTNLTFDDVLISVQGQGTSNVGSLEQTVDIMSLSFGLVFKL